MLKNARHEKFALALFKGMSQKDAAIDAGYKPSRAYETASRLVRNGKIIERKEQLQAKTESDTVLSVKERKERLSELAREEVKQPVTAKEVVTSISELNKMEGEHAPERIEAEVIRTFVFILPDGTRVKPKELGIGRRDNTTQRSS